jgi:peroxiredoxin
MTTRRTSDTRVLAGCVLACVAALGCAPEAGSAEQATAPSTGRSSARGPSKPVPAARFGEPFPAASYANLNRRPNQPERVDLARLIGSRPVILYYWIAGNPRADEMFRELDALVGEVGRDKVALVGVVLRRSERDDAAVANRIGAMQLDVPVLDDPDFEIGQRLRIQSVPNVSIIDAEGRLRLANGASLDQDLEYKMTLGTAVRRVAETGKLGTYGYLERYYPVRELVGKKCPDFKAPLVTTSIEQHWSSLLRDDQINVLIFWSVDCPHCRKSLPQINEWLKTKPAGVNVVSAAQVASDATRVKTKEFCDLNGFVFPTLVDQDMQVSELYQVTSTPTILIIGPDGVIDSAVLDGHTDLAKTIEEKKKALL